MIELLAKKNNRTPRRKAICQECGGYKTAHRHHNDYAKPDETVELCVSCHRKWHAKNGSGKNRGEVRAIMIPDLKQYKFVQDEIARMAKLDRRSKTKMAVILIEEALKARLDGTA